MDSHQIKKVLRYRLPELNQFPEDFQEMLKTNLIRMKEAAETEDFSVSKFFEDTRDYIIEASVIKQSLADKLNHKTDTFIELTKEQSPADNSLSAIYDILWCALKGDPRAFDVYELWEDKLIWLTNNGREPPKDFDKIKVMMKHLIASIPLLTYIIEKEPEVIPEEHYGHYFVEVDVKRKRRRGGKKHKKK